MMSPLTRHTLRLKDEVSKAGEGNSVGHTPSRTHVAATALLASTRFRYGGMPSRVTLQVCKMDDTEKRKLEGWGEEEERQLVHAGCAKMLPAIHVAAPVNSSVNLVG